MFSLHTHTGISSASRGFSDSSIKIEEMVVKAKEIGLKGIAITDHECVGAFVKAKQLEEEHDFPVICGNEIYLVSDEQDELLRNEYEKGMYYPHFLLLALDEIGNQQLRELSTLAWVNSYTQRGLVRTPTLMSDMEKIIGANKGHVVASSACLGSQLSKWIVDIMENQHDFDRVQMREKQIEEFVKWCVDTLGENNFYLECQPPSYIEGEQQDKQVYVNQYMLDLSKRLDVGYIITTDCHYLSKELLPIHSAFLNSKDGQGEREVDEFYATAYLMDRQEVVDYFTPYWDMKDIETALENTCKIGNRAKRYDLKMKQVIPKIELVDGWEITEGFFPSEYEYIQKTVNSQYEQDRYLMFLIEEGVKKLIVKEDYKETFDRIEQEVTEFWHVSDIIEDRLGAYFVTVAKIVEIMWDEGDSLVGVGRGSVASSIIAYLLEVTQLNPIKMPVEMPFYRFIDRMRAEIADVDLDTQGNRRMQVFLAIRKYFERLGGEVVNCCTYGTLGSKSAVQTACRGLDLPQEVGQAISSLIPTERGFTWSLSDCYNGNEESGRKPIRELVNLANEHKELWDIATLIEGVIVSRGVHASGVFITNDKFENYGAKMRSPDGTLTSQWNLHDSEQHGLIKYDFLTIDALSKIRITMDMLIENNHVEERSTLKETYYSMLDPHKMDYDKPEVWELVANNEVMDLFQFDSLVAMQTVNQIQPKSLVELAQTNSLMRLQPQDGAEETPTETYTRYRRDISLWYEDMDKANVPKEDQRILEKVLLPFNGVADTQEAIMALSRMEDLTNFSVAEAHQLRSIIGKKQMDKIPKLKQDFFSRGLTNGVCENTLNYVWNSQFMIQLGYSFSILHCMSYSAIAIQELMLYYNYPSIYWNTATLTVNSGSIDDDEILDFGEDNEGVDEEVERIKRKTKSTDYGRVAGAISKLQHRGVTAELPLINQADFSFTPDETNNRIIFGLKGILGINDDVANTIINLRPFKSFQDFYDRVSNIKEGDSNENVKIGNSKIITLIKAGAFDELEGRSRIDIMKDFVKIAIEPRVKLDFRSIKTILDFGIIPDKYSEEVRMINFRNHVLRKENLLRKDEVFKSKSIYTLSTNDGNIANITDDFFNDNFISHLEEDKHYWYDDNGNIELYDTDLRNCIDKQIDNVKQWLNTQEALDKYNDKLFNEHWDKYCEGTISKWEMDSVSFYSHDHELEHINADKYNIVDFDTVPVEPKKVGSYRWGGREIDEYAIYRIAGTVLDRDKTKHTVSLLTTTGVTTLKLYSGSFAHYDRQITEQVFEKGKQVNRVVEPSWFKRGTLLSVVGFRRGDLFIPKKYRGSIYQHTIQKITNVNQENGDIGIQSEREHDR